MKLDHFEKTRKIISLLTR
ncbi:hypothetical protein MYB54_11220 [Pectobacterium sp. 21LCBS03]|nr:hypothetical protein MYB54_11220 [Pectobacterium sp. 21LCBS03]